MTVAPSDLFTAATSSCAFNAPITEEDTPRLYMLLRRTLTDMGTSNLERASGMAIPMRKFYIRLFILLGLAQILIPQSTIAETVGGRLKTDETLTIEDALAIKTAVITFIRQSDDKEIRCLEDTIADENPVFIREPDFGNKPFLVMGLWIFDESSLTLKKRVTPGRTLGIEYSAKLRKADSGWEVMSINKKHVMMRW